MHEEGFEMEHQDDFEWFELPRANIAIDGIEGEQNGFYLGTTVHKGRIAFVATKVKERLEKALKWAFRAHKKQSSVPTLLFLDSYKYRSYARLRPDGATPEIIMNLGCISELFGWAIRYLIAFRKGNSGSWDTQYEHENWERLEDRVGELSYPVGEGFHETNELVLDALVLQLLHEVAHIVCGHLPHIESLGRNNSRYPFDRRALELEADIFAGWMYCHYWAECKGRRDVVICTFQNLKMDVAENFALVTSITNSALQTNHVLQGSRLYHLPRNRVRAMNFSATIFSGWKDSSYHVNQKFSDDMNQALYRCIEFAFWPERGLYPHWIGLDFLDSNDRELITADENAMRIESFPRICAIGYCNEELRNWDVLPSISAVDLIGNFLEIGMPNEQSPLSAIYQDRHKSFAGR
jgi:hypothetical protein